MQDRMGVRDYPVRAAPPSGTAQTKVEARLSLMQNELARVQSALAELRHAVQLHEHRQLTSALMDSRNWVLSVLASHSYVQEMLGPSGPAPPPLGKGASLVVAGHTQGLGPAGVRVAQDQIAQQRQAIADTR